MSNATIALDQIRDLVATSPLKLAPGEVVRAVADLKQRAFTSEPITHKDAVPFLARCGSLVFLAEEIGFIGSETMVLIRGIIISGVFYSEARGKSLPGDRITIGPLTTAWERLTIPDARKPARKPRQITTPA